MPDFSEMEDEAKKLAGEHPDMANKGIEEAGQAVGDRAGGKFDSQIEQGEQKAEEFLGTDQQGGQGQQTGNP
jgi:MT0933-like antitoxin protein